MKTASILRHLTLAATSVVFAAVVGATENPRSDETLTTALNDAHALIAHRDNFEVVRIEGNSMLPFFGNGAVLIVKKMPVEKLKVGMVVVYTNRFNETIAHRLVSNAGAGWKIQGYNNSTADSTLVTDANLIGVVYATLHSDGIANPAMLVDASAHTSLAFAAPAR